jgi:two-component system cell cycle sensor histidine kinase/response regulator CckA
MDDSASYPDLHPGTYLKLSMSDTGHGMDKAIIPKIFDPFFTTKPVGQGTGMGLSITHGIVKSHGGDIKVYSEPGKGTVFNVYFPMIEAKPVEPRIVSAEPVQEGSESILLVDDEEPIVRMVEQTLERLGVSGRNPYRQCGCIRSLQSQSGQIRSCHHRYDHAEHDRC